ncbi:hypothetical protein YC2023_083628 [Brassica napus]
MVAGWEVIGGISFLRGRQHILKELITECSLVSVMAEVDRILRPQGTFIVSDDMEKIGEIEKMMKSLKLNVIMTHSRYGEGVISVQKSWWRPTAVETITSAIATKYNRETSRAWNMMSPCKYYIPIIKIGDLHYTNVLFVLTIDRIRRRS